MCCRSAPPRAARWRRRRSCSSIRRAAPACSERRKRAGHLVSKHRFLAAQIRGLSGRRSVAAARAPCQCHGGSAGPRACRRRLSRRSGRSRRTRCSWCCRRAMCERLQAAGASFYPWTTRTACRTRYVASLDEVTYAGAAGHARSRQRLAEIDRVRRDSRKTERDRSSPRAKAPPQSRLSLGPAGRSRRQNGVSTRSNRERAVNKPIAVLVGLVALGVAGAADCRGPGSATRIYGPRHDYGPRYYVPGLPPWQIARIVRSAGLTPLERASAARPDLRGRWRSIATAARCGSWSTPIEGAIMSVRPVAAMRRWRPYDPRVAVAPPRSAAERAAWCLRYAARLRLLRIRELAGYRRRRCQSACGRSHATPRPARRSRSRRRGRRRTSVIANAPATSAADPLRADRSRSAHTDCRGRDRACASNDAPGDGRSDSRARRHAASAPAGPPAAPARSRRQAPPRRRRRSAAAEPPTTGAGRAARLHVARRRQNESAPDFRGAPSIASIVQLESVQAAPYAAFDHLGLDALPLPIGIWRGFLASGISRTRSTCRRPFSSEAPFTWT